VKVNHTQYKKNYKSYILDCLDVPESMTEKDKINHLFDRFASEYGFMVRRVGKPKALAEWLSGLAIDIPYYYEDIVDLAVEMGSIEPNPDGKTIDLVCDNYWDFMAKMILSFEPKDNYYNPAQFIIKSNIC